jgi:isopenicillin-N N-acyltransferase-like protein
VFDRAPVGSCANNLLVDHQHLADVEATPDGYMVTRPADERGDYLVHTNHFRCASLAADEKLLARLPDSTSRCDRMEALIRERAGSLTLADLKGYFADHNGYPQSICRHPDPTGRGGMKSIYSVIGEPDRGRLHVSVGNPCESDYYTYDL